MMPEIFFSAGEVSGDIYGADLMRVLKQQISNVHMTGIGGDRMIAEGLAPLANVVSLSAVGLTENLPHLVYFWKLFQMVKTYLKTNRPQVILLIDFQGLNTQIAKYARTLNIPTIYYMAPQEWIWGFRGGAKRLADIVTHILAVFKPEAMIYEKAGGNVTYIGHPLLDMIPSISKIEARNILNISVDKPVICLMPGSRILEVKRLLPVLLTYCRQLPVTLPATFLLPVADAKLLPLIEKQVQFLPLQLYDANQRYTCMGAADLIVGASGNAALEAAVMGVPMIAIYQVSQLTHAVAKRLMRSPYITLPNILAAQPIIPEFIQEQVTPENLLTCTRRLLLSEPEMEHIQAGLLRVRQGLEPMGAVQRAVDVLKSYL